MIDLLDLDENMLIAKQLVACSSDDVVVPKYYRHKKHFIWIINQYWKLLHLCQERGYKNVLDFGCGIGVAGAVHDRYHEQFDFTLSLADWEGNWEKEKDTFDHFLECQGMHKYDFTSMKEDTFCFLEDPPFKFDAVLAARFVPMSKLDVTPDQFKERIQPYCVNEFELVYANVSLLTAIREDIDLDVPLYNQPCKYTEDDDQCIKVMIW